MPSYPSTRSFHSLHRGERLLSVNCYTRVNHAKKVTRQASRNSTCKEIKHNNTRMVDLLLLKDAPVNLMGDGEKLLDVARGNIAIRISLLQYGAV